jgi:carboxyl-terminal processing protease
VNKKKPQNQLGNIIFVVILCLAWFAIGWIANGRLMNRDTELIDVAFQKIVDESIYNQSDELNLSYAAIRGMLSEINDPYAELIEPHAAQALIDTFAGKTGVIGLYAENIEGQVVVLLVFQDGPADIAGIEQGDVILSIDGIELDEDSDSSETGLLIRGAPDEPVELEILRKGETYTYSIVRQQREFVSVRMLPEGIGYISLNGFNVTASQSMKEELKSILDENPSGLIWDLRVNEGGDMLATQEILSYFIEDGLLFSAELTDGRTEEFYALGNALVADIPLVVLMDHGTYSAAETAAIAIADHGRGITLGSTSYGKGIIQATLPLVNDVMLQMTVARWNSPTGENYHERGVVPQYFVEDDKQTEKDEVIEKAIEILGAIP